MLKVNNLTVTTLKGRKIIDNFSFVLNDKDKLAVIGEEGNGKSTLLKIMAGIDVSEYVSYTGDIISVDSVAYLPQKIDDEYLNQEVMSFITDGEEPDYPRIYELIKQTGLSADLIHDRIISTLSGGEKVKVSIMRLLYNDPDILLLDEPTNDLDLKTLIWLETFINNTDKTVMFISHDETLLSNCATSILHLEQLKRKQEPVMTYSSESYRDYHKRRQHNIDRTNQLARKEKAQLHKQLEKYRQIYQKVEHRQATISRGDPHGGFLLKKKMHAVKALGRKLEEKQENMTKKYEPEEAINIFFEDVSLNPDKIILDLHLDQLKVEDRILSENINLHVRGADKICIIGENGCGKTTLMKVIEENLTRRNDITVGYMSQNYYEIMDYGISPTSYLYDICEDRSKAQSLLGSLKFTSEEMTHAISELSEGQKCKIILAGLILRKCNVLLLDEPTRNLSPLSNPEVRRMLVDYGGCIMAISHDRLFIDEVCTKVYQLDRSGLTLIDG
ncbi:MAG: ABC-F family ATP-binding cassette domain-containing protein [Erysipelotrichaceae bacterium]|nr:ABC-F family ATP-binding cassette domain-containing protein [Erysipelotrichaceae bacterium]